MVQLWKGFRGKGRVKDPYDLGELVHLRVIEPAMTWTPSQIICDIDKTYLETEFESFLKMARIAFEAATDKVTVSGASEVLAALRSGVSGTLHFVSSSPPQLRKVLEEKLLMDGLSWSSDTFKNQAYNLRRGRVDLLRHHVAYKSAAILQVVRHSPQPPDLILIGDNAESDPVIYLGVKLLLEGRLDADGYEKYLELAGTEPVVARAVAQDYSQGLTGRVCRIYIRTLHGRRIRRAEPLTNAIIEFDQFLDVALVAAVEGFLEADRIWQLARLFHNRYGMTLSDLYYRLKAVSQLIAADHKAYKPMADIVAKVGRVLQLTQQSLGDNTQIPLDIGLNQSPWIASQEEILSLAASWMHVPSDEDYQSD